MGSMALDPAASYVNAEQQREAVLTIWGSVKLVMQTLGIEYIHKCGC